MHEHLVFVAKSRPSVFLKEILDDLRGVFVSVCADSLPRSLGSTARTTTYPCG
jgi:REP element-mobilizing transposase RayT